MSRIPILIVIAGFVLNGVDRIRYSGERGEDVWTPLTVVGLVIMAIGAALELLRRRRATRSGQRSPHP